MSKKVLGEQAREEFNHKRLNTAKNDKTKYMSINFSKGGTKEERKEKKKAIKEVLKQEEEDYVHMYSDGSVEGGQGKRGGACVTRSREMKSLEERQQVTTVTPLKQKRWP